MRASGSEGDLRCLAALSLSLSGPSPLLDLVHPSWLRAVWSGSARNRGALGSKGLASMEGRCGRDFHLRSRHRSAGLCFPLLTRVPLKLRSVCQYPPWALSTSRSSSDAIWQLQMQAIGNGVFQHNVSDGSPSMWARLALVVLAPPSFNPRCQPFRHWQTFGCL